jgi:hypothetical protein
MYYIYLMLAAGQTLVGRTPIALDACKVRKPPSWPRSWANFSLF